MEHSSPLRTLTEAELDLACGGVTGQGVATAITTGGTTEVLSALPGLITATEESGLNPPGHGQITAAVVTP
jgi:hypothetical protein